MKDSGGVSKKRGFLAYGRGVGDPDGLYIELYIEERIPLARIAKQRVSAESKSVTQ